MKRTLLVMVAALLAVGCGGGKSNQEPAKQVTEMQRTLDSCIAANPNYNNNDITRATLADSVTSAFQLFRGKQLKQIENIPCEYEMALVYGVDPWQYIDTTIIGKYVVKFSYSELLKREGCLADSYKVSFQVFAILEKEAVMQLVEGSKYYLTGTFRDFANNTKETGFRLPSGQCSYDYPSIKVFDGETIINLGTIVLDNITFKPVQ